MHSFFCLKFVGLSSQNVFTGKTNIALLAILNTIREYTNGDVINKDEFKVSLSGGSRSVDFVLAQLLCF